MVGVIKKNKIVFSILLVVIVGLVIYFSMQANATEEKSWEEELEEVMAINAKNRELGLDSRDVTIGMTPDEVKEVAGQPNEIYEGTDMEMWYYEHSTIVITHGKVTMTSK